jgi:hypothetical protein
MVGALLGPAPTRAAPTTTPATERAPALQQEPPPPSAAPQAISCDNVPFDRVLTLGAEKEIFVGFRGGFGTSQQAYLQTDVLDANGSNLARDLGWPQGTDTPVSGGGWPVGTAADVNGDGTREMVMVYTDAGNAGRLAIIYANGTSEVKAFSAITNHTQLAIGTISSGENVTERIAVASRTGSNSLELLVVNPQDPESIGPIWRTNQDGRASVESIDLAVGDTDLDGSSDDMILGIQRQGGQAEVIVLTRDGTVGSVGSGSNLARDMRLIAAISPGGGTSISVQVAAGDLDGDYSDEVIFAQEDYNAPSSPSASIDLIGYRLNYAADKKSATFEELVDTALPGNTGSLQLAAGDTDRDGLAEAVLAYEQFGNDAGLRVRAYDIAGGTSGADPLRWTERGFFSNIADGRNDPQQMQLAVGDMDKNGREDIVAAFRDGGNQLQVVRLRDTAAPGVASSQPLTFQAVRRDAEGGRNSAFGITLALGDSDNDSLKAYYDDHPTVTVRCREVEEPTISSAVFTPPYWSAIQFGSERHATIGKAFTGTVSNGTGFTTSTGHSVFGYVGGEVDATVAEFAARLTFGYETTSALTRENGSSTSQTISTGWSNQNSLAVVHNAKFHCYNYQLRTGTSADQGSMRFCRPVASVEMAPSIDTWDSTYGPIANPDARQWAPIARDWASLTIFREETATQSSTAPGGEARRAADGTPDGESANGSVSSTNQENVPWWQVDLGARKEISKIRVWNRGGTSCDAACRAKLTNVHVFVSDIDPATISNDPQVLKNDQRVRSYFHSGPAETVINLLTLGAQNKPILGRYVRVQLAGTGQLQLAEVQVFGRNTVEPDRYPLAARDNGTLVGGKYQPATDGWFEVQLFNPETTTTRWVRVRGNLLWNGASSTVLGDKQIGPGGSMPSWLLTNETSSWNTTARAISQEMRVGAEFDAAVGVGAKVTFGGGYEASFGREEQETRTVSWSDTFEVGGGVAGFPDAWDWAKQCSYTIEPIQYELTEYATSGFAHRMMMVDYLVPDNLLKRGPGLSACQPSTPGATPSFTSDADRGAPGSTFTMVARNFAAGGQATLQVRGPGEAAFRNLAQLTLDANGGLVFALSTSPTSRAGEYQVRLIVVPPGETTTQNADLKFTLDATAPPVVVDPDILPVDIDNGRQLFLPVTSR